MAKPTSSAVNRNSVKRAGRQAGVADAEIGARIRRVRSEGRITQEALAESLGISCHQLQKYENGDNRVSASRLIEVARCLNVATVALLADSAPPAQAHSTSEPAGAEIIELLQSFCAIQNVEARKKVREMARFLAGLDSR
jgi:transcriptional regulator with XRE-family HTH domain